MLVHRGADPLPLFHMTWDHSYFDSSFDHALYDDIMAVDVRIEVAAAVVLHATRAGAVEAVK